MITVLMECVSNIVEDNKLIERLNNFYSPQLGVMHDNGKTMKHQIFVNIT